MGGGLGGPLRDLPPDSVAAAKPPLEGRRSRRSNRLNYGHARRVALGATGEAAALRPAPEVGEVAPEPSPRIAAGVTSGRRARLLPRPPARAGAGPDGYRRATRCRR